jgi:hypothetical protein
MIHNSNAKTILLTLGTTATNATSTATVDLKAYDTIRLAVFKSTTHAPTVFKIEHSDTTDATSFVSCGLTGGTDFTIPAQSAGTTNPYAVFDLDTCAFRRYLLFSCTPGASSNIISTADLARPAMGAKAVSDVSATIWVRSPER